MAEVARAIKLEPDESAWDVESLSDQGLRAKNAVACLHTAMTRLELMCEPSKVAVLCPRTLATSCSKFDMFPEMFLSMKKLPQSQQTCRTSQVLDDTGKEKANG